MSGPIPTMIRVSLSCGLPLLVTLLSTAAFAADWNSTGGSVPDAPWSGDTPPLAGNPDVGALEGEGGASGGSATYSIPIKVVPGRAGMQPSVSLNYSSAGDNGVVGVGWSLSAGSAISRCAKTPAQDRVRDKVNFVKATDRLCLNGQRLIAVSGGYGNTGTQYRTEMDSFARVVQYGDMDGTSTYFVVTNKNGSNDYYGATSNSRHSLHGLSKTLSWKISRSVDVSGNNAIHYSYTSHGNGESTLSSISYTGTDSSPGDRYVEFSYESRPDFRQGYQSGGMYVQSRRLETITTRFQAQTVRQYRLTYQPSSTSGNSLLKSVEECGYDGATAHCFPATQFTWYENSPSYPLEKLRYKNQSGQMVHLSTPFAEISYVLPKKDMNGDGTLDWHSIYVNSEGEFAGSNSYEDLGQCQLNHYTWQTRCANADFNQDGLTDSWKVVGSSVKTFQYAYANYNGAAPQLVSSPITLHPGTLGEIVLGITDLNGDGHVDVLVRRAVQASGSSVGTAAVVVFLHSKNNAAPYTSSSHTVYSIPARRTGSSWKLDQDVQLIGDFDGNGIDDIFVFQVDFSKNLDPNYSVNFHKPKFRRVLLSQSNPSAYSGTTYSFGENMINDPWCGECGPIPEYSSHQFLFDLNGDGLLDVLGTPTLGFTYRINKGNGQLSEWMLLTGDGNTILTKLKKGIVPLKRSQSTGGGGGFPGLPGNDSFQEKRLVAGYVLDHDQNGAPNMMVPYDRVVSFCFEHPVVISSSGTWGIETLCDDDMYRIGEIASRPQPPLMDFNDRSLYRYHRADFTVTGYNANGTPIIAATLVPTTLVATLSNAASADVFGNGHTDFLTMISCITTYPQGSCTFGDENGNNDLSDFLDSDGIPLTTGAYINRNAGSFGSSSTDMDEYEVVDRIKSATTAFEHITEWDYLPLNTGKAGSDFYGVNQQHLGTTPNYLHFSANMNVVQEVRYSDGIGGLRAYRYHYRDATLQTGGRGFQGFESVIVDDVANYMRSVSDYHVRFPLTGQLAERRSCPISAADLECDNLPVEKSEYSWDLWRDGILRQNVPNASTSFSGQVLENSTAENRYWVSPSVETTTYYHTASSQSAGNGALQPIVVSSGWAHQSSQSFAFDTNSCTTSVVSIYQEPGAANKSETTETTSFYPADHSAWWLCKANANTRIIKSVSARSSDYATIESGSDPQKQVQTIFSWDGVHRKPSVATMTATQGGGRPTRVTTNYSQFGLPTTVTVEGSRYNNSSFNLADRVTSTTYTSDGYFPETTTNAKGHVTAMVVDARYGLPVQVTDANGQVASNSYDAYGRLKSSKAAGEPTRQIGYWWCSGIHGGTAWCSSSAYATHRKLTRAKGAPDVIDYLDSLGRLTDKLIRNFTNDQWYRTRWRFDERQHLRWETNHYDNRNGANATYTYYDGYDNIGRLTRKRTRQANDTYAQTSYLYDGHDVDVVAQSYGINSKTLYMSRRLNGMSQLVRTVDADNGVTEYAYDGAGNPISIEDPNDNRITTQFNALGQKNWVHDPNAGNRTFKYNSLGELEWEQDANGNVVTYTYDTLGRIYNRWTDGAYSGVWRYDNTNSWGRLGAIDYEYNTNVNTDRLTKYYRYSRTTGGKDYLSYTWHHIYENGVLDPSNKYQTIFYVDNNFGRPKGMKFATTGLTVAYDYVTTGYLSTVRNASSGYVYREVSDQGAVGNVIASTMGDGVLSQVQMHHPATGQMTANSVTRVSDGTVLHELEYDYDGFGNLYQSVVRASNGMQNYETYGYDKLHRMTASERAYSSVSLPNEIINYDYDALGNITLKDDYFLSASYGNSARNAGGNAGPNAIRSISYVGGGSTNYIYDDNGNMLSGDGRTVAYNEFNLPVSVSKGGVSSAFSYGADKLRYRQMKTGLPGGTQTTFYVDKHFEMERQGSKLTYRHYIGGVAVLRKVDTGGSIQWLLGFHLADRLGSVVTLADEDGTVLEHRSFDPFGKPRRGDFVDAGTIQGAIASDPHPEFGLDPITDRGFTNHEHLDEQQIIHMNGRIYDYNIGRFSSVDPYIQAPVFSQSVNAYSYIMNNPLAGRDPSGYSSSDDKPESETTVVAKRTGYTKQTGSNLNRSRYTTSAHASDRSGSRGNGGSSRHATGENANAGESISQSGGVYQSEAYGGGDKGDGTRPPPTELSGSGSERRQQFESLSDEDNQDMKDWFAEARSEIFAEQLASSGDELDSIETGVAVAEGTHVAYEWVKHGTWHAVKGGVAFYVAGKVVLMIPEAVMEDRHREYRMALNGYREKVFGKYPDMGSGNYSRIPWPLYDIEYNERLSVDLYFYVTDQADKRPPECRLDRSC